MNTQDNDNVTGSAARYYDRGNMGYGGSKPLSGTRKPPLPQMRQGPTSQPNLPRNSLYTSLQIVVDDKQRAILDPESMHKSGPRVTPDNES